MLYGSNITCSSVSSAVSFATVLTNTASANFTQIFQWADDSFVEPVKEIAEDVYGWLDRRVDEVIDWAWRK